MLKRIKEQGLDITPRILIVSSQADIRMIYAGLMTYMFIDLMLARSCYVLYIYIQVTRLLPDAVGTTCGQRLEKVYGTEHSHIIRVPFRTEKGMVRKWISRFEVWPYMETFAEVR